MTELQKQKLDRQKRAEELLIRKEREEITRELLPLMLDHKSKYLYELSVGNNIESHILDVTAYGEGTNSMVTIYSFDSDEMRAKKLKLIKDMFAGKVPIEEFTGMKFL